MLETDRRLTASYARRCDAMRRNQEPGNTFDRESIVCWSLRMIRSSDLLQDAPPRRGKSTGGGGLSGYLECSAASNSVGGITKRAACIGRKRKDAARSLIDWPGLDRAILLSLRCTLFGAKLAPEPLLESWPSIPDRCTGMRCETLALLRSMCDDWELSAATQLLQLSL
jgi:hypothetical protein